MYLNGQFYGKLLLIKNEEENMIQPRYYVRPSNLTDAWEALEQEGSFPLLGGGIGTRGA